MASQNSHRAASISGKLIRYLLCYFVLALGSSTAHPARIRLVSSGPFAAQARLADEARTFSCAPEVAGGPLRASLQAPCQALEKMLLLRFRVRYSAASSA